MLLSVNRSVDLSGIRQHLAPFYSSTGRPSVDPEMMIQMLLVGYIIGIRSARRLCEKIHLNLAYRWFRHLDLTKPVDVLVGHTEFNPEFIKGYRPHATMQHLTPILNRFHVRFS